MAPSFQGLASRFKTNLSRSASFGADMQQNSFHLKWNSLEIVWLYHVLFVWNGPKFLPCRTHPAQSCGRLVKLYCKYESYHTALNSSYRGEVEGPKLLLCPVVQASALHNSGVVYGTYLVLHVLLSGIWLSVAMSWLLSQTGPWSTCIIYKISILSFVPLIRKAPLYSFYHEIEVDLFLPPWKCYMFPVTTWESFIVGKPQMCTCFSGCFFTCLGNVTALPLC